MKHHKGYIREEQVRKLINYFKNKAKDNRDINYYWQSNMKKALLLYVLWKTGRRISEIVGQPPYIRVPGLRPIDIDFENKEITFSILKKNPVKQKDKYGKPRKNEIIMKERHYKERYEETITYSDDLFTTLKVWIANLHLGKADRLFPYSRFSVDRYLKDASNKLDLRLPGKKIKKDNGELIEKLYQISAHSFRHGFAINFLKKNDKDPAALPILQELLCHFDINVTKTYLRFNQEDKRRLLNRAAVEVVDG